jgi:GntR family transcriptional regulator/MocR family aminotransferase
MVGPEALIKEARALRRLMLRHPPANNQRSVALFLSLGHHDALITRTQQAYKLRWSMMHTALQNYMPNAVQTPSIGGTSMWIKGPEGLDCRKLASALSEHGVLIGPGDVYFHSENPPKNYMLLGFSAIPSHRIDAGIQMISEFIDVEVNKNNSHK